jgi:hypothetical protein
MDSRAYFRAKKIIMSHPAGKLGCFWEKGEETGVLSGDQSTNQLYPSSKAEHSNGVRTLGFVTQRPGKKTKVVRTLGYMLAF